LAYQEMVLLQISQLLDTSQHQPTLLMVDS